MLKSEDLAIENLVFEKNFFQVLVTFKPTGDYEIRTGKDYSKTVNLAKQALARKLEGWFYHSHY